MDEVLLSVVPTFKASIRSVGTACTLAGIGVYLHQRGFVAGDGKKTLALIAQQVTIPLLLFTKIIFCNQDWSNAPCPDITKSLGDVWLLFFWPVYAVGWGLVVGWCAASLSNTPRNQIRAVLVACGFSNSTGLPITLLSVVHANFPSTSDLGRIDPTLFLSVYLLMYPILQWGVGGWLLAPEVDEDEDEDDNDDVTDVLAKLEEGGYNAIVPSSRTTDAVGHTLTSRTDGHGHQHKATAPIAHNVLNNKLMTQFYRHTRRGIHETDASMYISHVDLIQLSPTDPQETFMVTGNSEATNEDVGLTTGESKPTTSSYDSYKQIGAEPQHVVSAPLPPPPPPTEKSPLLRQAHSNASLPRRRSSSYYEEEEENLRGTVTEILTRCLQPPVVGAMAGMLVASITPLRGIFVDLKSRSSNAPLQWFFDGLYAVGQAAVPLNMMILGSNISASFVGNKNKCVYPSPDRFSVETMMAIVLGKMVVMPIIGVLSACVLKYYLLDISDAIAGSFYLVIMIVFITPTANNVMVMVELSGAGVKEGMAQVIMLQYAVAPIILCLTMSVVVGIASEWS